MNRPMIAISKQKNIAGDVWFDITQDGQILFSTATGTNAQIAKEVLDGYLKQITDLQRVLTIPLDTLNGVYTIIHSLDGEKHYVVNLFSKNVVAEFDKYEDARDEMNRRMENIR